jgi:hypothetical protein
MSGVPVNFLRHSRERGSPALRVNRGEQRDPRLHGGDGTVRLRRFAKGAGAVVVGLIALDFVATLVTLAAGVAVLK